MPTALALPRRPGHYGQGSELPVGQYLIRCCVGGVYTVERVIGIRRWYPLTARDNPAWRTWSSFEACAAECMDHEQLFTCADWPHWGRS